jgi:signal transduction histidine kinase
MLIEGSYGKLGERPLKPLQNVYKSNERLIKLVNDLLSVSRIEAGRVELEFKEESIEDVISTVVEELGMEARKKGIDLKWQKPKEPLPKVLIDKEKFRQVILNVVDNAIRYTKSGYVAITAKSETRIPKSETQGKIIIEVKDTGEGLSKEEIAKLFESFSRASAGSRLWTEGAGLGLYVAKKFVEMHKGRIWAESEGKGKGATFCIELPMK